MALTFGPEAPLLGSIASLRLQTGAQRCIILQKVEQPLTKETTMSKKDLIDAVAEAADITKDKANTAIDALTAAIVKSLKAGEEVTLAPLGKFKVSKRDARQGRNPSTGETVEIKAATVAKFQASKALKDALN
jgi:DNA-binding protein HU-beta